MPNMASFYAESLLKEIFQAWFCHVFHCSSSPSGLLGLVQELFAPAHGRGLRDVAFAQVGRHQHGDVHPLSVAGEPAAEELAALFAQELRVEVALRLKT